MLCSTLRQTDTPLRRSPMAAQPLLNSLSSQNSNIEHSLPAAGIPPSALRGKYRYQHTNFCRSRRSLANHSARCTGTSYMTTPSSNASLLLSLCFSASPEAGARITNSCRKSHLFCMTTAEKQEEQTRRRRQRPLRIVSISSAASVVIVIIIITKTKSTKPAREAQK